MTNSRQIVVGITKAVSDRFGKGGIADRMIWFNGFPFLDNKEDHTFGVPVSQVMMSELTTLPAAGMEVRDVEKVLEDTRFQGFPIVEDAASMILVGYVGRTELRYALDRARRDQMAPPRARCFFTALPGHNAITPSTPGPAITFDNIAETAGQMSIDLSKFVDSTPLAVHPRLPLETVMELFKKLGPRVILVEHRGRLTGLVTVKDCLKYQFHVEAHDNPKDDSSLRDSQDRLWHMLSHVATWLGSKKDALLHRSIRLRGDTATTGSPRAAGGPSFEPNASNGRGSVTLGTADAVRGGDGMELENR